MSSVSYTLLIHSPEMSYTGSMIRTDLYSGNTQNLHTISIHYRNFTGRLYIEGTIAGSPTETDWFPIYLTSGTSYRQYPINPLSPTGNIGDTGTEGFTFRANLLYIRARIDRSYIDDQIYDQTTYGIVDKVLLNV